MVATSPAELSSRARWERQVEREIDHGKRGVLRIGSQRVQGARERGRGRPVAPESTARIHGGQRRRWRRRRLHGVLRLAWLDEEVEGVAAELGSVSRRRGEAGGGGYGERRRRLRSASGEGAREARQGEREEVHGRVRGGQGSRAMPRRLRGASVRQASREEAWRLTRACTVPPLPTGRG